MMIEVITLLEIRGMAERAGITLAEDELQLLLPGVNRARKQAAELRHIISVADDPADTFDVAIADRR